MKKFNVLICILLIIFTLTACGETEEATNSLTSTAPTTATTALPTSTAVPESSSVAAKTEATTETVTATETATVVTASVTTTESTTAYSTTETTTTKPATTKQQTTTKATTTKPTTTKKQTTSKVTTTKPTTTKPITTTKPTTTKPAIITTTTTKPATTKPSTTAPITQATTEMKKYCTVRIECNTIYDNISKLKEGKKDFLPSSGVILDNVEVELSGGESAFDVIKKACEENVCTDNCKYCKANGVHIEYTYTPAFHNYYIEGIHQIYEKDCGTQSGWMYSVNGNFPDEGSSSYTVSSGDVIVFSFTCNMGEDIGNYY